MVVQRKHRGGYLKYGPIFNVFLILTKLPYIIINDCQKEISDMSTCFDFNYMFVTCYQFLVIICKINLVKHKLTWMKT